MGWHKGPIPYFIFGGVSVGDSTSHPTLTRLGIAGQPPWSTNFTAAALGNTFADNAGAAQCGP